MRRLALAVLLGVTLTSCRTPWRAGRAPSAAPHPDAVEFFAEAAEPGAREVRLPVSGVRAPLSHEPWLTGSDIRAVDVEQAELGAGLRFELTPPAAARLGRWSADAGARPLVLIVNGRAYGVARRGDLRPDGTLFLFVEIPDAELTTFVTTLRTTLFGS